MESDPNYGENLAKSKVRLIKMLDEFTTSESITTYPGDAFLLTLLSSKLTMADMLAEYRSVLGSFMKLLNNMGSSEKLAEKLIGEMKKLSPNEYLSVPMTEENFLVLKLRILKTGRIVGYVQFLGSDKENADKRQFQPFYAAILEGNGFFDDELDYWPL